MPLRALALPRGALGALYGTAGALMLLGLLGLQSLWRALLAVGAFALAKLLHLDLALAGVGLLDELLGLRGQKKIKFPPQGGDDGEDDLDP